MVLLSARLPTPSGSRVALRIEIDEEGTTLSQSQSRRDSRQPVLPTALDLLPMNRLQAALPCSTWNSSTRGSTWNNRE
jgi:hypothetical protein